jgi:hypothetical protein
MDKDNRERPVKKYFFGGRGKMGGMCLEGYGWKIFNDLKTNALRICQPYQRSGA